MVPCGPNGGMLKTLVTLCPFLSTIRIYGGDSQGGGSTPRDRIISMRDRPSRCPCCFGVDPTSAERRSATPGDVDTAPASGGRFGRVNVFGAGTDALGSVDVSTDTRAGSDAAPPSMSTSYLMSPRTAFPASAASTGTRTARPPSLLSSISAPTTTDGAVVDGSLSCVACCRWRLSWVGSSVLEAAATREAPATAETTGAWLGSASLGSLSDGGDVCRRSSTICR